MIQWARDNVNLGLESKRVIVALQGQTIRTATKRVGPTVRGTRWLPKCGDQSTTFFGKATPHRHSQNSVMRTINVHGTQAMRLLQIKDWSIDFFVVIFNAQLRPTLTIDYNSRSESPMKWMLSCTPSRAWRKSNLFSGRPHRINPLDQTTSWLKFTKCIGTP